MLIHRTTYLMLIMPFAPLAVYARVNELPGDVTSAYRLPDTTNKSSSTNDVSSLPYPPGYDPTSCRRRQGSNLWDSAAGFTNTGANDIMSSSSSSAANVRGCAMIAQITYRDLDDGYFLTPPVTLREGAHYFISWFNTPNRTIKKFLGRYPNTAPGNLYPVHSEFGLPLLKRGSEFVWRGKKELIAVVEYGPGKATAPNEGEIALFEVDVLK